MTESHITFTSNACDAEAVTVSTDALNLLATCINEAIEAVGEWEFSVRLGFTVDEARALMRQVGEVLEARGRVPQ